MEQTAATAARMFRVTLGREFPRLLRDRGHVIADGAIFVLDWFRDGLVMALAEMGHGFSDIRRLYLDLPDQVLFGSIRERAQADPSRAHELKRYSNVAAVAESNKGFQSIIRPTDWEAVDSRRALEERLLDLLRG